VEFEQRIHQQHRLSLERKLHLGTGLWSHGSREPFDLAATVEAIGFEVLSPFENELLTALEARMTPLEANFPTPPAIRHLQENLFRNRELFSETEGLHLIEAPGDLGEARLVAREISTLIRSGVKPGQILITARDVETHLDLWIDLLHEYGIPVSLEGELPVQHDPSVIALLRAFQLLDDDFPFAGTTALLRNRYFAPTWGEAQNDPDLPRKSEGLLRLLGEARGKQACLNAVRIWAESPPEGLEDEEAEESHRLHKIYLARTCRPFLTRFFRAWDRFPQRGVARDWVRHLREFARELGFFQTGTSEGWLRWWELLERWAARPHRERGESRLNRASFRQMLHVLGGSPILSRSREVKDGVRLLPVEQAIRERVDYLFVLTLGEGSFPQLGTRNSLLDDADREALIRLGCRLISREERLASEQRLFLQLLSRAKVRVTLSYSAVDARGQAMLPSSFLLEVKSCFSPESIPTTHQRMLIEGYTTRPALAASEFRVQLALRMRQNPSDDGRWNRSGLPRELIAGLLAAQRLAQDRFERERFGMHDGWLEHPLVIQKLKERFAPEKPMSATALETYIYCPFRFFFEQVLRYEELSEPEEVIEQTRRGAAVHRALSRFHSEILSEIDLEAFRNGVPDEVQPRLERAIEVAVEEYAQRASSAASRILWRLEGKRLQRQMSRYRGQWEKFLEPWRAEKLIPQPLKLEAGFGLPETKEVSPLILKVGDVEVRIGGRIDRIDVVDLDGEKGFWIIDYKTGRSSNYTASGLKAFEKLQLPLYALAVQRIFFPNGEARPLGLAYWLVTEDGPKVVLPDTKSKLLDWFQRPSNWEAFREQLENGVVELVHQIRRGQFPLAPKRRDCTSMCNYSHVCRIGQSRSVGKRWSLSLPLVTPSGGES
jgi:ATP-dependent helicase/DNAse subunit B